MADYDRPAKQGTKIIRMRLALLMLREFGGMGRGLDTEVRHIVRQWIDNGMEGPIPYPSSPFFQEWAARNGISKVDRYVGYRATARLASEERDGE